LDGLPQGILAHPNMGVLQCLVDSVDAAEELSCNTKFVEVYTAMTAEDEFEDILAYTDADEPQQRTDTAGVMQVSWTIGLAQAFATEALEDQYVSSLAQADIRTLQHHADDIECAPKTIMIDCLPKVYVAMAADDALEVGIAHADMIDMQGLMDATDNESPSWNSCLSRNEAVAAALDNLEGLAAAFPGAYLAMVEDDKMEADIACADICHLQCCADAAEDLMDGHFWAAGLQKAIDDIAESDKLEAGQRMLSGCSTCVSDALAYQVSAPMAF